MKTKILNLTIYCVLCCSCFHNPLERNKLVFKNSYQDVQDSLLRMNSLLSQLPRRKDSLNRNYFIKDGKLFVNDRLKKDGLIKSKEFVNLTNYLNKNFISCGYEGYGGNTWRYEYRTIDNNNFNDSRNIILLDNRKFLSSLDSVIDRKDKMYLTVGKGAIIR